MRSIVLTQNRIHRLLATGVLIVVGERAAGAQTATPAAPMSAHNAVAPDTGAMAPDFTLPSAAANKQTAAVNLKALRGKVVVIAFYPGDKTTGCTAEFTKFRDEYSTLFGEDVAVLPISADGMASHAAWSDEMRFPFALLSDTSQTVAAEYGSTIAGRAFDNRTVFVVGKDGRITYRNLRFGALNEGAYRELAAAVAAAKGH